MAKVLGLGGIFFKCKDPKALTDWYAKWLNIPVDKQGYVSLLPSSIPPGGCSVWGPFKQDTEYFKPSDKPFMMNLMVDDLDAALAQVAEGGAQLVGEPMEEEYGRFGWFMDPEGNKIELWEPPEVLPSSD